MKGDPVSKKERKKEREEGGREERRGRIFKKQSEAKGLVKESIIHS